MANEIIDDLTNDLQNLVVGTKVGYVITPPDGTEPQKKCYIYKSSDDGQSGFYLRVPCDTPGAKKE